MTEPQQTVVSDPEIALGRPVVSGTRITVELILEKLAAGESVEDLLAAHPRLTREGVKAALAHAAAVLWRAGLSATPGSPRCPVARLAGLGPGTKARLATQAVAAHGPELDGTFSVLGASSLRIRRRE